MVICYRIIFYCVWRNIRDDYIWGLLGDGLFWRHFGDDLTCWRPGGICLNQCLGDDGMWGFSEVWSSASQERFYLEVFHGRPSLQACWFWLSLCSWRSDWPGKKSVYGNLQPRGVSDLSGGVSRTNVSGGFLGTAFSGGFVGTTFSVSMLVLAVSLFMTVWMIFPLDILFGMTDCWSLDMSVWVVVPLDMLV